MSVATIAIDEISNFVVGTMDLSGGDSITDDILIKNNDANGAIKMIFSSNSNGAAWTLKNGNNNTQFRIRGNGASVLEKSFTGLIDPTKNAGHRGDISFGAVSDNGSEESTLITLHYDATNPLLKIRGQMLEWERIFTTSTSANITYAAAELISGMLERDVSGARRNDSFPDASDLVAGINEVTVGTTFNFTIKNTEARSQGNVDNVIDIQNGAGMTFDIANTLSVKYIAPQVSRTYRIRITNTTGAAEAYTVYHLASHNILAVDGFTSLFKNTSGTTISLNGGTQDLIALLNASGISTFSAFNQSPTQFEITTGGVADGIKSISAKRVKVEATCRLYAETTSGEMFITLRLTIDNVGLGAIASNHIEAFPSGQLSNSVVISLPIAINEIIGCTITSSVAWDIKVYNFELRVQGIA